MTKVFKNKMGTKFLKELFYETTSADKSNVVYTLKNEDHLGFPSLYRLYMAYSDPTEYQFAIDNLADWDHWEQLTSCSWFKPYIQKWRREAEIKQKSYALSRVLETATSGSKDSLMANKYLLEKKWVEKDSHGRGRPTKDEILEAAKDIATENSTIREDLLRLGVTKYNG